MTELSFFGHNPVIYPYVSYKDEPTSFWSIPLPKISASLQAIPGYVKK